MTDEKIIQFADFIVSERLRMGSRNDKAWDPVTKTDLNRWRKFDQSNLNKK